MDDCLLKLSESVSYYKKVMSAKFATKTRECVRYLTADVGQRSTSDDDLSFCCSCEDRSGGSFS